MKNPLNHLTEYEVFLGSGSPRRHSLFSHLEISFKIIKSEVEEIIPGDVKPEDGPVYLSKLKSDDLVSQLKENYLLVTADTIVLLEQEILGKPTDLDHASQMLSKLQGRNHEVITGVTLRTEKEIISFSNKTIVGIAPMSESEIHWSIRHSNVLDKAGAYGIQDWLGMTKVNYLKGSYYNVMGLPVDKLYHQLAQLPKEKGKYFH